jgi:hypothetical protein
MKLLLKTLLLGPRPAFASNPNGINVAIDLFAMVVAMACQVYFLRAARTYD